MRRPGKTADQRRYDREMRALLRLRRAAVRWSELEGMSGPELEHAELQAAADAYNASLSSRDRRRLLK